MGVNICVICLFAWIADFIFEGLDFFYEFRVYRFRQGKRTLRFAAFSLLAIVAILLLSFIDSEMIPVELESWVLYSLNDDVTSDGNYYIYIDNGRNYYSRQYKDGEKTYSVRVNESYIVKDDYKTPKLYKMGKKHTKNTWFWGEEAHELEYKFVVPKGSVKVIDQVLK